MDLDFFVINEVKTIIVLIIIFGTVKNLFMFEIGLILLIHNFQDQDMDEMIH